MAEDGRVLALQNVNTLSCPNNYLNGDNNSEQLSMTINRLAEYKQ